MFRHDTIYSVAYDVNLYRERWSRIAVNFSLYATRIRMNEDTFTLLIDDIISIGVMFQDSHQ